MPRIIILLVSVGVLLASTIHPFSAAAQPSRASVPAIADQYIVAIKPGRDARAVARDVGVTPKHVYSRVLNGFLATLNAGQRTALTRYPDVAVVEADQIMVATGTQIIDPTSGLWGLDRLDQRALPLSGSYTYTTAGAGVTAYVIDSGLQANHPDFGTRAQNVYDAFGESGNDCHGHGTHLAGIVGGSTYGVAKQVSLRGVRVLQCDAQGFLSDALRGLDWVKTNAVKPAVATLAVAPKDVTAANSLTLQLAIQDLIASGVFVAVAAGNGNSDGCALAPANVSAAFTAAASTRTDQRYTSSSYGTCIDSYAPGAGITSTWLNGTTNTLSGTSQATAFVAGVAALYKATNGDAPQPTINSWLIASATQNVIQNNPAGTPNRLLYWNGSLLRVSVEYTHSCGLRTDSTIICWGSNAYGEETPPSGTFIQVSAGRHFNCAIRTNQTLACWGNNGSGQSTPPTGTFTQVDAGEYHACGVRTDKTVACWGATTYGRATPPTGTFTQVDAGYNHTCGVRTDTTVACWGADTYLQASPPSGAFTHVSSGVDHTCGLRTDSTIVCWGANDQGQRTPPTGTFIQVDAGNNANCAVRTDSILVCWGYNDYGQTTAPSGTFTQISLGWRHNCGIRSDGSVACWGWNNYGQTTVPATWY
ncbi:MAG TPA: S8 family serine peptidase [Herpetosiphonaceae bacterium]